MNWKHRLLSVIMVISVFLFSGCSSDNKQNYSRPTATTTERATIAPTAQPTPTVTPVPTPEILSVIHNYLKSHENTKPYTVSTNPQRSYSEHMMKLVYDEAPSANGTAYVVVNTDSKNVNVHFSESSFFGAKVCAPPLIQSVIESVVTAICEYIGTDNVSEKVLLSYEEGKYTYITYAGDYAFIFAPSSIYIADFYAVYLPDYHNQYNTDEYKSLSYDQFNAKLYETSKCAINASVKDIYFGSYSNSFSNYPCMMMKIEDKQGNSYTVAHHMYKVPLTFIEGKSYTFYGTTMFDNNNKPLLYLHYAEYYAE